LEEDAVAGEAEAGGDGAAEVDDEVDDPVCVEFDDVADEEAGEAVSAFGWPGDCAATAALSSTIASQSEAIRAGLTR
jgi:hypothetical protein